MESSVNWDEFDDLDHSTHLNDGGLMMSQAVRSSSDEEFNTLSKVSKKAMAYEEINISSKTQDKIFRFKKRTNRKLKHIEKNWYQLQLEEIKQEMFKYNLKNNNTSQNEIIQNQIKDKSNLWNWTWVDLQDPEVFLQEYYGQSDLNDNLDSIEEASGEMMEISNTNITTEHPSFLPDQSQPTSIIWEGVLKKFDSKTSKYTKRWCVLTDKSFGYFRNKFDTEPIFAIDLRSIHKITPRNDVYLGWAKYKFEISPFYEDPSNESFQGSRQICLQMYEEVDLNDDTIEAHSVSSFMDSEFIQMQSQQIQSLHYQAKASRRDLHEKSYDIEVALDKNSNYTAAIGSMATPLLKLNKKLTTATRTGIVNRMNDRPLSDNGIEEDSNDANQLGVKHKYIFGWDDKETYECWMSLINTNII